MELWSIYGWSVMSCVRGLWTVYGWSVMSCVRGLCCGAVDCIWVVCYELC